MKNENVSRILIPVDFSPVGYCALEQGAYLANVYRADIHLLHVIEVANFYPPEWFDDKSRGADKELIQAKVLEKLSQLAEDITQKYGVYVQHIITTGKPASKIVEAVAIQGIDLIVMGAHGRNGFEEFFIGGTAHKVVNLSPCPVITVREGFNSTGFKSIVLPIDETLHSRQKVKNTLPLAVKCKALVHILGVIEGNEESDLVKMKIKLNTVQEAVEKAGLVCIRKIVHGNNVAMESMKYADEVKADLLSIMTDHESSMSGMFMGLFAGQIVNHSKVPVLSIKPVIGQYEAAS